MDKTILVTGASSGIGEAIARELAAHGGKVLLGARRGDRIAAITAEIRRHGGTAEARTLDVTDRIAVAVTDSPKPPPERVSLTFAALNRTRAAWFLVSGEEKAAAVAAALGGADLHDTPAAGVSGQDETVWFLDRAAASRL